MNILATSVWLRYLEAIHGELPLAAFPSNGYKGDYIFDIATALRQRDGDRYAEACDAASIAVDLPPDKTVANPYGDQDAHIDALIERAKALLGPERYQTLYDFTLNSVLADIRGDLEEFGVVYDCWFSEHSLASDVDRALTRLEQQDLIYQADGAYWFRSTRFDDDKDRVVRRLNGQTTYFASDIAYVENKFSRGFDRLVYVWGADHHGTIARLKAACQALGYDPKNIDVPLVQFVNLYSQGERLQMSTRSGQFITLRELRNEVGNDAARFFYVNRKNEQHLDFDLDLAKSQSKDNPVYYIQYAHARVCRVLERLTERGWDYQPDLADLTQLVTDHEQALLAELDRYPEMVESAALAYDPQQLANYLRELANAFHSYYNEHKVLVDDPKLRNARLKLSLAVRQIIRNGLALLGVTAPESM